MSLSFQDLLAAAGHPPGDVALCLHKPGDATIRAAIAVLPEEAPDLFEVHQKTHPKMPGATLKARSVMASFVATEDRAFRFVGLYRRDGWTTLTAPEIDALPGFAALFARLGEDPFSARGLAPDWVRAVFDFRPLAGLAGLRGRLVVADPGARAYVRRAERTQLDVLEIARESRFVPPMPAWDDLVVDTAGLRRLPRDWAAALAEWRGIYLIVDRSDGARYVGAAYGRENLLGRWRAHVAGEAGVTAQLSERGTESFRFSILDLLSPAAPMEDVVTRERGWMRRLDTIERGLNA